MRLDDVKDILESNIKVELLNELNIDIVENLSFNGEEAIGIFINQEVETKVILLVDDEPYVQVTRYSDQNYFNDHTYLDGSGCENLMSLFDKINNDLELISYELEIKDERENTILEVITEQKSVFDREF